MTYPQIIDRNPLRLQETNLHPIYGQTLKKEQFGQQLPLAMQPMPNFAVLEGESTVS